MISNTRNTDPGDVLTYISPPLSMLESHGEHSGGHIVFVFMLLNYYSYCKYRGGERLGWGGWGERCQKVSIVRGWDWARATQCGWVRIIQNSGGGGGE